MKFRSSMTLFARAGENGDTVFGQAIERCCGGEADSATQALLATESH
jgi:uncharacterized protein (DUF1810 family)